MPCRPWPRRIDGAETRGLLPSGRALRPPRARHSVFCSPATSQPPRRHPPSSTRSFRGFRQPTPQRPRCHRRARRGQRRPSDAVAAGRMISAVRTAGGVAAGVRLAEWRPACLLRFGAERVVADLYLLLRLVADLDAGDRGRAGLLGNQLLRRAVRAAVDDVLVAVDAVADLRARASAAGPRQSGGGAQPACEQAQVSTSRVHVPKTPSLSVAVWRVVLAHFRRRKGARVDPDGGAAPARRIGPAAAASGSGVLPLRSVAERGQGTRAPLPSPGALPQPDPPAAPNGD